MNKIFALMLSLSVWFFIIVGVGATGVFFGELVHHLYFPDNSGIVIVFFMFSLFFSSPLSIIAAEEVYKAYK